MIEEKMDMLNIEVEKHRYGLARVIDLQIKLADLESGCNITLVKKKGCSMKDLFNKWKDFQLKFGMLPETMQIGNAGPVRQI